MEGSSCKKLKKLSKCLALAVNSSHRANHSKAVDRACHNNNRALVVNKDRACHSRALAVNSKVYRANSNHR